MFKRNHILFGFLLAVITTTAAYFLLMYLNKTISAFFVPEPIFSTKLVLIFALASNLPALYYYGKRNKVRTQRGIILFAFAFTIFYVFMFAI